MKKFILASVALIAVFASCKKEDIRTVYKANPAEVTITVQVYDALYGENVTSKATVSSNSGTVSGNTVKLVGDEAHFNAIPAQKVTVSASYDGRDGSETVDVNGVLEGGVASYSITVVVGSPIDPTKPINYKIENAGTELASGDRGYLEFATHSYNGRMWVINNSEFVLYGLTKYEHREGIKSGEVHPEDGVDGADFEYLMNQFNELSEVNPLVITETEYPYTVSAFSYFNVMVGYDYLTQSYDCYRINILQNGKELKTYIGSIELTSWVTGVEYKETASPDHAGHYVFGHGVDDPHYSHYDHGHGHGGSNAGGGIVIAD